MFEKSLIDRLKGLQDAEKVKSLRADAHSPKNSGKPIVSPRGEQQDIIDVFLFDVLSFPFLEAQDIVNQIPDDAKEINLHINSPGGSVWEGVTVYNWLKQHQAAKNVYVEGLAGSIASIIAMVGDEKPVMAESAYMMIHDPWIMLSGNARELRKEADLLEKLEGTMADIYADKSGRDRAEIREWMHAESWFSGPEAIEYGLAGSMEETAGAALASAQVFNLAVFNQTPAAAKKERKNIMDTDKNKQHTDKDKQTPEALLEAERQRVKDIYRLCKLGGYDQFAEKFIADGTSIESAREQVFAQMEKDNPPFGANRLSVGTTEVEKKGDAIVDGLLMRTGFQLDKPAPGANEFRHTSIVDLARDCLQANTRENVKMLSPSETIRKAIKHRGMHSTDDFPAILENTGNKMLRQAYENAPSTFERWTVKGQARDFKELSRVQLSEAPDLLHVPESAEYSYGTFGESKETFSVLKFGRLFSISWEALVNDDLQSFARISRAFVAAAKRGLNANVYGKLIANAAMNDGTSLFHGDHSNLADTGGALSIDTLSEGRRAMRMQKGLQTDHPLNIQPAFLLVPSALETDADSVITTAEGYSSSGGAGQRNPFYNKLEVVAEPTLDGDSEAAWYLAADPQKFDTIEVAYLDGYEQPYLDEEVGFTSDSWTFKIRFAYGLCVLDHRGFYKNPGE